MSVGRAHVFIPADKTAKTVAYYMSIRNAGFLCSCYHNKFSWAYVSIFAIPGPQKMKTTGNLFNFWPGSSSESLEFPRPAKCIFNGFYAGEYVDVLYA